MKIQPALFLWLLSSFTAAAHWPQFHGPMGNGVAADDKPAPAAFGLAKNVLWNIDLPPGHSSPCIWNDRIFLTAYLKETKTLVTLCVERASGRVLWRQETRPAKIEKVHRTSNPATATPATDGKLVFVYFGSYGLLAYDLDGNLRWEKKLPLPVIMLDFGSGTSPIVVNDTLIIDLQLGGDSHILAVRTTDGETLWKADKPNARGWSSPVIWKEAAVDCVGMLNAGRFTAYNLKDGTERWWLSGVPNQVCATPLIHDGVLYLNGTGVYGESENIIPPPPFQEALAKFDVNKDGLLAAEEIPKDLLYIDRKNSAAAGNQRLRDMLFRGQPPSTTVNAKAWDSAVERLNSFASSPMMASAILAVRVGGQGDVKGKQVLWTQTKGIPEVPSLVLYRERLYAVKSGGVLTCRSQKTGQTLFEERLEAGGGYFASPIAAGGRVYTSSDRGVITIIRASDKLEVLGQAELKEPILATPAIVEGKLYVRTEKHLFAFGE